MPDRPIIAVASVGDELDERARFELQRVLASAFGAEIVTAPRIPFPLLAYDPTRRQCHSTPILRQAIHELGHTYHFDHGTNPRCVMWFSNTLAETDRKGLAFCAGHASQLAKIRSHA